MMLKRCRKTSRFLVIVALLTLAASPASAGGGRKFLFTLRHNEGLMKLISENPVIEVLFITGLVIYACYKLIVFIRDWLVQSKLWYYQIKGGAEEGPVDEATIRQLVREGKLNRGDMMRSANGIFWIPAETGRAGAVTGLAGSSSMPCGTTKAVSRDEPELSGFAPAEDGPASDPFSQAGAFTALGLHAVSTHEGPEAAEPPPLPTHRTAPSPPPLPKKRARAEPPPLPRRRTARS